MGTILRYVGIFFLISRVAGKSFNAAYSNVDWNFLPIRRKDFRLQIREGKLLGVIRLRMAVTNSNPVPIMVEGFKATISQGTQTLGIINTTDAIQLPVNEKKELGLSLDIDSTSFLERVKAIAEGAGALDPIKINGVVNIQGGNALPISQTVSFFSVE